MNQNMGGKTFLVVGSVFFGITGVLGCWFALMSSMLFDAPHSDENPATKLMASSIVSYPFLCVTAIIAAWILYARGKPGGARATMLLPILSWIGFGIAWLWLSVAFGGKLGG